MGRRQNPGLGVVPRAVGEIVDFGGSTVPAGFILAYGQNVSRTTYAALFAAYGTAHGSGDGSSTFGVPDLRGRTIVGKDNMGGTAASRLTGGTAGFDGTVLGGVGGNQAPQSHGHGVIDPGHAHSVQTNDSTNATQGSPYTPQGLYASYQRTLPTTQVPTGVSVQSTGAGASGNVQPSLVLNKLIYTGVWQ